VFKLDIVDVFDVFSPICKIYSFLSVFYIARFLTQKCMHKFYATFVHMNNCLTFY